MPSWMTAGEKLRQNIKYALEHMRTAMTKAEASEARARARKAVVKDAQIAELRKRKDSPNLQLTEAYVDELAAGDTEYGKHASDNRWHIAQATMYAEVALAEAKALELGIYE